MHKLNIHFINIELYQFCQDRVLQFEMAVSSLAKYLVFGFENRLLKLTELLRRNNNGIFQRSQFHITSHTAAQPKLTPQEVSILLHQGTIKSLFMLVYQFTWVGVKNYRWLITNNASQILEVRFRLCWEAFFSQGTYIAVLLEYKSKHNITVKYTLRCNHEGVLLRRLNSGRIQYTVCITIQMAQATPLAFICILLILCLTMHTI